MDANNLVLLRGTVTSEPVERTLPSGDVVTRLEISTRLEGRAVSAPVVLHRGGVLLGAGAEVVVVGHVGRRFFRSGGATQSRTEVVATPVVKAGRRRGVERAIQRVRALVDEAAA